MLRLRKITGETAELLPDFRFIELCSVDGKLAAVVWQDDAGTMHLAKQGDPELTRYSALFNTAVCPTIDLTQDH